MSDRRIPATSTPRGTNRIGGDIDGEGSSTGGDGRRRRSGPTPRLLLLDVPHLLDASESASARGVDGTRARAPGSSRRRGPPATRPSALRHPGRRRGRQQRDEAVRAARRRLARTGVDGGADEGGFGKPNGGGEGFVPPLLFRRSDAGFASTRPYRAVAFLNGRAVVAVDDRGDIDVVGLSSRRRFSFCHGGVAKSDEHDERANDNRRGGANGSGKLLADRLRVASGSSSTTSPFSPHGGESVRLFGLRDGTAFAAGMPCGECRVFDAERGCGGSASASISTTTPQLSRSHRHAPPGRGGDGAASVWECTIRLAGPRRRYLRNDAFSLHRMMTRGAEALRSLSKNRFEWREISGWEDEPFPRERSFFASCGSTGRAGDPFAAHRNSCSPWAFRETNGGTGGFLAAFVDPEMDCFSLRFFDGRCLSPSSSGGGAAGTPVLCLGGEGGRGNNGKRSSASGSGSSGRREKECVTSVCFSGEHGIATAHATADEDRRNSTGWSFENVIRWWDHRMMRKGKPAAASLVSFLSVDVCDASPICGSHLVGRRCVEYACGGGGGGGGDGSYCRSVSLVDTGNDYALDEFELLNRSCFQICRLDGSNDSGGRVAATLQSRTATETLVVDSSRQEIHRKARVWKKTPDGASDFIGRDDAHESPIVPASFSSQLDSMVSYGKRRRASHTDGCDFGGESSILLFDMARHSQSYVFDDQDDIRLPYNSKKRPFRELIRKRPEDECDGFVSSIDAKFQDAYGLQSSLSCMVMDEYGTSIVCGTTDGDLFWIEGS